MSSLAVTNRACEHARQLILALTASLSRIANVWHRCCQCSAVHSSCALAAAARDAVAASAPQSSTQRQHFKMPQDAKRYSPAVTVLLVTLNYVFTIAAPPLLAWYVAANVEPRYMYTATQASMIAWLAYVTIDNCELKTGRPDAAFSKDHWDFSRLRAYFQLKLHRTDAVQAQLKDYQAIFAFFPHGVNSDFRVLMAGPIYDEFQKVHARGAPRTLAASILFKIPGVRTVTLKTGCVDAGRSTANRCLRQGLSLFLCPGGQDEQLETICGRERVYLKSRKGFCSIGNDITCHSCRRTASDRPICTGRTAPSMERGGGSCAI